MNHGPLTIDEEVKLMSRRYLISLLAAFEGTAIGRHSHRSPEDAYKALKHHTGKDFGKDYRSWAAWIEDHPVSIKTTDESLARAKEVIEKAREIHRRWKERSENNDDHSTSS